MKEDRRVGVPMLRARAMGVFRETGAGTSGADPIPHAVGRQRIVIPGEFVAGAAHVICDRQALATASLASCCLTRDNT
jgi:hypothetical protein